PSGGGRSFAEVVRDFAGDTPLEVGSDLVLARYDGLLATGPLAPVPARTKAPAYAYTKARAETDAQCNTRGLPDTAAVAESTRTLLAGDGLLVIAAAAPVGLLRLDVATAAAGLDGLLVTSPHSVELFTGLSYDFIRQQGI